MKTSRKFSRIGTAALGLAALLGSGCAMIPQNYRISESEASQIRQKFEGEYKESSLFESVKSCEYDSVEVGLKKEEKNQWINHELPKLIREKDEEFMKVLVKYSDIYGKECLSLSNLTKRQKLELRWINGVLKSMQDHPIAWEFILSR
ncbi:MAG: hypothetical protein AABX30_00860 [Nanoarchaeota archaeon]